MTFVVYTDTHCGSPIETHSVYELIKQTQEDLNDNLPVIWNGDNIDLANVKRDEVENYFKFYDYMKSRARGKYATRREQELYDTFYYNDGNHERTMVEEDYTLWGDIYFTHGDLLDNPLKWQKYRKKEMGASWFKRTFVVRAIELFEKLWNRKPDEDFIEKAIDRARDHRCRTIVFGHFHFHYDRVHDGIRIIILDKGRHELDL